MASFSDMDALNAHMLTRSYVTGYALSDDDLAVFNNMPGEVAQAAHPHAYRWYCHVAARLGIRGLAAAGAIAAGAAPAAAGAAAAAPAGGAAEGGMSKRQQKKAAKAAAKAKKAAEAAGQKEGDDDDDFDVFGDDDEEEEDPAAARRARAEQAKAAKDKKKKVVVERTQVVIEVKPVDIETDLVALWRTITSTVTMEGLTWGEGYNLEDVAFGIQKLQMSAIVIDSQVPSMEDLTDPIEAMEDQVQSVDVVSMNKI